MRHGPDQQRWVERVAADYDNVRAAMNFALEHDLTLALRLVGRLSFFLYLRGGFAEAKAWLDAILPRAAGQPQDLLGRAHECAAVIAERIGDIAGQARHSDEAYAAFAAVGDEQGMADALRERGKTASARGDVVQQNAIYTELAELAERIGDRWNGAIALNNLGYTASQSGDWERAVELCGRSSALRRELGDEWGMALALTNVAFAELQLGRLSSAASSLRVALDASMKIDAKTIVHVCLDVSVGLAAARGRMHEAARLAGATSRLLEELGSVRDSFEGGWFERAVESIRASLGADADAEIQRGRDLSLDEAAAHRARRNSRPGLTAAEDIGALMRGSSCPSRDIRRSTKSVVPDSQEVGQLVPEPALDCAADAGRRRARVRPGDVRLEQPFLEERGRRCAPRDHRYLRVPVERP